MAVGVIGEVAANGWASNVGGPLVAAIDEATASDADFIYTAAEGAQPATFYLEFGVPAGTHTARVRANVTSGSAAISVSLLSIDGAVLGTSAEQELSATLVTYDLVVPCSATAHRMRVNVVTAPAGAIGIDGAVIGLDGQTLGLV
jgi:hypothetical protein